MRRLVRTAIALAIAVSGSSRASSPGGMRLLAKEIPDILIVVEDIPSGLTRNGANKEAVRNQVELSMRRCGFTIVTHDTTAGVFVIVDGMSHAGRGYSGSVNIKVSIAEIVRGETVFIEAWSNETLISGPPGRAAMQIRNVLSELLDQFCNSYLQVRDEVRGKAGK